MLSLVSSHASPSALQALLDAPQKHMSAFHPPASKGCAVYSCFAGGVSAAQALRSACQDLKDVSKHISSVYAESLEEFKKTQKQ